MLRIVCIILSDLYLGRIAIKHLKNRLPQTYLDHFNMSQPFSPSKLKSINRKVSSCFKNKTVNQSRERYVDLNRDYFSFRVHLAHPANENVQFEEDLDSQ